MTFIEKFIAEASKQIKAPYIWGANGDLLWTPQGMVSMKGHPLAFDCVGLVKWAMLKAGGPDWRPHHNAQTMYDYLSPGSDVRLSKPHLRYYGIDIKHITHISIAVGYIETAMLIIEAAGGGRDTKTITPGAEVAQRFERRTDFIGTTVIPIF